MMTRHPSLLRSYISSLSLVVALGLALLLAGVALANAITINTNDGLDDSAWPETPFRSDDTADAQHGYDIHRFWMGADAFPSNTFYFRVEMDAAIPEESYLEVRLDCNLNNDFFDDSDILVEYLPQSSVVADVVYVMQGDGSSVDSYRPEYGEATNTAGAYEWSAPTTAVNTDWDACTSGQISVRVAAVSFPSNRDEDLTTPRTFSAPTAVSLAGFHATTGHGINLVDTHEVFLIGMGAAALLGFVLWKKRQ